MSPKRARGPLSDRCRVRPQRKLQRLTLALFLIAPSASGQALDPKTQAHQKATASLGQNDLKTAQRELEASYLRQPNPTLFELLGQVAERRGDKIAAADYYRRFLEESSDSAAKNERVTNLISYAQSNAAELVVRGESAAFLRLDGRLVGQLPLARGLLVAPGAHTLSHERAGKSVTYSLTVQAGVPVSLRFVPESPHVAIEERPAVVLVVFDGSLQPAPQQASLGRAVLAGLRHEGQAYDLAPERVQAAGPSPGCFSDLKCLLSLTRRIQAHGALLVSASPPGLAYLDARSGVMSERADLSGTAGPTSDAAQTASRDLTSRALNRAYASLEIKTQPPGAEVSLIDSAGPLVAPAALAVLAGPVPLLVRKPGFLPIRAQLEVPEGERRTLDLTLRINEAAVRRRKVGVAKWVLLSAGGLGIAGGLAGTLLDGYTRPPSKNPWEEVFQSEAQGITFLSLGVLAVGGSISLYIYERSLAKKAIAAEEANVIRSP